VQKVLAFIALQDRPVPRSHVAASLWPDATEMHAVGNLRSALWKLSHHGFPLIDVCAGALQLAASVTFDFKEGLALARLAIASPSLWEPADGDVELLSEDLLPGWYDDWVLVERESYRQLRLHALEALCERLTSLARFGSAVQAGVVAVTGEPLRESAHRALIGAFLAEGNPGEAIRQYGEFSRLLRDELGLEPSGSMQAQVAHIKTAL
jgi:DNA-binding SARP family transcriptional activator